MQIRQSRRNFLNTLSLAGAASILGPRTSLADEPPLETTTVRLAKFPGAVCEAPKYVAEELLRAEGFTDIRYLEPGAAPTRTRWWRAASWISISTSRHRS